MKDLLEIILSTAILDTSPSFEQEYVQKTQLFCCRFSKPPIPTLNNIGNASAYHTDRINTKRERERRQLE